MGLGRWAEAARLEGLPLVAWAERALSDACELEAAVRAADGVVAGRRRRRDLTAYAARMLVPDTRRREP